MKPTYDEIMEWMKGYFATLYDNAESADHRHLDAYFAPDLEFIPYTYVFGGPGNAVKSRQAFYDMLTSHPEDYEQFVLHDIFVDEKKMVSVAFLQTTVYDAATNEVKVQKEYLPLYELILDEEGALKIKTIRFFWEASPPEVDAAYTVDKMKSKWRA